MGNYLNKQGDHDRNGKTAKVTQEEHEANSTGSKSIRTYLGSRESFKNVFEHETAHEFLESHVKDNQHMNYEVELHCYLNKQIVLQSSDEISQYWDEVESIHIVLAGTGVNRDADTRELNEAITLKPN